MLRLPELEYECSETTRVSFSSKSARLLGSRGKFEREVASLWDKIESIGSWPKQNSDHDSRVEIVETKIKDKLQMRLELLDKRNFPSHHTITIAIAITANVNVNIYYCQILKIGHQKVCIFQTINCLLV